MEYLYTDLGSSKKEFQKFLVRVMNLKNDSDIPKVKSKWNKLNYLLLKVLSGKPDNTETVFRTPLEGIKSLIRNSLSFKDFDKTRLLIFKTLNEALALNNGSMLYSITKIDGVNGEKVGVGDMKNYTISIVPKTSVVHSHMNPFFQ